MDMEGKEQIVKDFSENLKTIIEMKSKLVQLEEMISNYSTRLFGIFITAEALNFEDDIKKEFQKTIAELLEEKRKDINPDNAVDKAKELEVFFGLLQDMGIIEDSSCVSALLDLTRERGEN